MKHVIIVGPRFQLMVEQGRPQSEAPIGCSRGAVTTSGEWDAHRGLQDSHIRANRSRAARRSGVAA